MTIGAPWWELITSFTWLRHYTTVCFIDQEAISGGSSNHENDVANSFVERTYWPKCQVSLKTFNNLKIAVLTESYSKVGLHVLVGMFGRIKKVNVKHPWVSQSCSENPVKHLRWSVLKTPVFYVYRGYRKRTGIMKSRKDWRIYNLFKMKDIHKVMNNNFSDSLLSKAKFCTLGQSFMWKLLELMKLIAESSHVLLV